MSGDKTVEKLGSGDAMVSLSGRAGKRSPVAIDGATMARLAASLSGAPGSSGVPDRVFLNLENVRSRSDAVLFQVYVGLPPGAPPEGNPEHLAGTVSLFGASAASDPTDLHAGSGTTHVIEITRIVDRLHLNDSLDGPEIGVDLVPVDEIPEGARVEIGNISIYRQSE